MKRLLLLTFLLAGLTARAQTQAPIVTAHVEPDSIGIGDCFELVVEVEKDLVQTVLFPEFSGEEGGIELVHDFPIDTLVREGRQLKLRKRYTLQAFDQGRYNLGTARVLYADKNIVDTLSARDSLYLEVGTFQIDSTSQSIYDLKPQKTLPFKMAEITGYLKFGAWLLVVLVGAFFALRHWLASRGKGFGDLFKPTPPQPPHVAAIQALVSLHHQKLWQNNKHKQYYSSLSDILRTYIEGRWEIRAMEMTSDQIVEAMRSEELPQKAAMDLAEVLRDADLVKFAKHTPDTEQNEADYLKCYYFVEETKLVDEDDQTQPDDEKA